MQNAASSLFYQKKGLRQKPQAISFSYLHPRSAEAIELKLPISIDALRKAIDRFVAEGNLADGLVYLRGLKRASTTLRTSNLL